MLGNIIGGFIVILVNTPAHYRSNPMMLKPESRLKSLRGQDRSVNVHSYARETDKGFLNIFIIGMIYSPNLSYNLKGKINIFCGVTLAPTVANEVAGAQANANITGASDTILGLTTLFYNLSIASTAIGIAAQGLRNSGLM